MTTMALLTAVALIIFVIEAQIPPVVPITGVKLGLSNIITVFAVWMLGAKEAAAILFVRIFLGAVFAGNFSTVFYSLGGGALALLTTVGLRRVLSREQLWIAGCLGAIAHSVGQMVVAVWISETVTLLVYLPIMIVCSIFTGSFTGLCAQILVGRDKLWKTIFK
ncbi:MAG: Gx transporter family protein [Oscillospiraceae bacterium]|nr:Gx transporter family protein [Oscillospiraceae bacterium]